MPAVFPVTTLADGGLGSLRQAILDANVTLGDDTITFEVSGIIPLAGALPSLSSNIDIQGPGADQLSVRRNTEDIYYGIFAVDGGATVTLTGLTITNGAAAEGGGIANRDGTLTLNNVSVSFNSATGWNEGGGGGIYNRGTLTLNNSTVSDNYGLYESGVGGIYNRGTLTLNNSTVGANVGDLGAGGIDNYFGTVTLNNSTVSGNFAVAGFGGGIDNRFGTVTLNSSTISGNSASSYGGDGGGIYNRGTLTLNNTTVSGNSAIRGGAIYLDRGSFTLNNTTVSGNSATSATFGGGGIYRGNSGTLTTRNSIVAGNTAPNAPDLFGNLGSLGHNLVGNTSGGGGYAGTDLLNVNPSLGPLQDNGGPTLTHALLPGSPALDAGDNTAAPATDQRGLPRIVAGTIDIGAFEVQSSPTPSEAGFEAPAVGSGFQYGPSGGGWTFAGGSGVAGNASAFTGGNPAAPEGVQVAFLQGQGSLAQQVAGWPAGTYRLTFAAAQRGNHQAARQDFEALVDGQVVGTFAPAGTSYATYATASFAVAAGAHAVEFRGLNTAGGDNTAFLDDVRVERLPDNPSPTIGSPSDASGSVTVGDSISLSAIGVSYGPRKFHAQALTSTYGAAQIDRTDSGTRHTRRQASIVASSSVSSSAYIRNDQ